MKKMRFFPLIFTFSAILSGCGCSIKKPVNVILKDAYKDYFTIGAAYNKSLFKSSLSKHFNSLTAENDMKWLAVHPKEDIYDFSDGDAYIKFAKKNDMKVRGHALIWHDEEAMPASFFEGKTKEQVIAMEKDHIKNVVNHFKDNVYCWDVCNEVIDDGTSPINEEKTNIYRASNWYNICGKDFIKEAYIQADKVLKELGIRKKVKLFYNDYDNTKPVKKAKTLEMLKWLIKEKVPIDGIGLQSHYHLGSFDPNQLESAIKDYAKLGLDVQITEFDVDIYDESLSDLQDYSSYQNVPKEALKVQATIYDRAFQIFRKYKNNISNVTFWGVYDAVTYMNDNERYGYRTNYPYIFDVSEGLKPAFYRITDFGEYKGNYDYSYYSDRKGEQLNTYSGNGKDFHLSKFYPTAENCFDVTQKNSTYNVKYVMYEPYAYIYTEAIGMLADFNYINIRAKGTIGRSLTIRCYYGDGEEEANNCLGKDVSFPLDDSYGVHSLKMKGTYKTRLDLLKRIALYPEIGLSGVSVTGQFTFTDVWFSKTQPSGSKLENPGVDSGDTSVTVNGWRTEGWTKYNLYSLGQGKTGVRYNIAADWASIEKDIEPGEDDNGLFFSFENRYSSKKPSITCMRIWLKGDVKEHIPAGAIVDGKVVEYEYDLFYEYEIYTYDISESHVEDEVQPDENGVTTLKISLETGLKMLKNHYNDGLKLMLRIESTPDDVEKYRRYRDGDMVILDSHLYHDDFVVEAYSQYGGNTYSFKNKEGVDKNISYKDVKRDAYAKIARLVETEHDDVITVKVRNNGEEYVRMGIHAGIYLDEVRSDIKNQYFYPLWAVDNSEMKNEQGYWRDGETHDINPGETITISISITNLVATSEDKIDVIQFLFDTCRGVMPEVEDPDTEANPKQKYSGNVDVVSVVISHAA